MTERRCNNCGAIARERGRYHRVVRGRGRVGRTVTCGEYVGGAPDPEQERPQARQDAFDWSKGISIYEPRDERAVYPFPACRVQPHDDYSHLWAGDGQRGPIFEDELGARVVVDLLFGGGRILLRPIDGDKQVLRVDQLPTSAPDPRRASVARALERNRMREARKRGRA